MRAELQPAFVLHTRPYRDTSLLVDVLTLNHGRIGMVARGVRQKKSPRRNLLNPFASLLISFQGKTDLKLLTSVEAAAPACNLVGAAMYCGFYLNELLVRLLPEMDAHPRVFSNYQQSLLLLQSGVDLEPVLRTFEFSFLDELGYGVNFGSDMVSGKPITINDQYRFDPQLGFFMDRIENRDQCGAEPSKTVFNGADILAINSGDFSSPDARQAAKRLSRIMLRPLLGDRPLKSRELFSLPVKT